MKGFVLCNPSTRKFRERPCAMSVCCGFGYDHVDDDYKVVKIVQHGVAEIKEVEVYSLKSDSWKRVQHTGRHVDFIPCWGKFVGGALYWMVLKFPANANGIVFGFDLGLEQFKGVSIPDVNGTCVCLDHVGGSLCITDTYMYYRTDVWLMNNHGAENHWCKVFSVEQPGAFGAFKLVVECKPVAFSNSGRDVLFEVNRTELYWYDLQKKASKNVRIHGIPNKFDTHLYTESLFQLTEREQL